MPIPSLLLAAALVSTGLPPVHVALAFGSEPTLPPAVAAAAVHEAADIWSRYRVVVDRTMPCAWPRDRSRNRSLPARLARTQLEWIDACCATVRRALRSIRRRFSALAGRRAAPRAARGSMSALLYDVRQAIATSWRRPLFTFVDLRGSIPCACCATEGDRTNEGPAHQVPAHVGLQLFLVNARRAQVRPRCRPARGLPVLVENRVQHLIEVTAIVEERLAQDRFPHRAQLLQRAVPATVLHRGTRLEAVHAERLERELDHQLGAVLEPAGAPERRSDREAPFGGREGRGELPDLEDPNRRVVTLQRHREARVSADATLPDRPRNEALEAFNRVRRRRDES